MPLNPEVEVLVANLRALRIQSRGTICHAGASEGEGAVVYKIPGARGAFS